MQPINIHTHFEREDEISIVNLSPEDDEFPRSNWYSAGIHPWNIVRPFLDIHLKKLVEMLRDSRVIAIGECGLDRVCGIDWSLQKMAFEKQIQLAEDLQKPMIIHAVKTYADLLHFRKSAQCTQPWIIHGFNGSEQIAEDLVESGCYLSFGHLILKPETHAAKVLATVSSDKYFLETDEKEKLPLKRILGMASTIRNKTEEQIIESLHRNFETCFKQKAE